MYFLMDLEKYEDSIRNRDHFNSYEIIDIHRYLSLNS